MKKWGLPTIEINGKTMYLYWCYGSNLNQDQMQRRCPDALPLEKAELPCFNLLFRGNSRGWGVATVEPKIGSFVPGALWAISDNDLINLDRYEGFPHLYTRGKIKVHTDEGEVMNAMTYWMHEERYMKAIPSREYMNTIYEGYIHFGLNTKRLRLFYDKHIEDITGAEELA